MTKGQSKIICDSFAGVGKFILTSVAFGIVTSYASIPYWIFGGVIFAGLSFIVIAVILNGILEKEEDNTMTAEIKKGIFHVQNAEITASPEN